MGNLVRQYILSKNVAKRKIWTAIYSSSCRRIACIRWKVGLHSLRGSFFSFLRSKDSMSKVMKKTGMTTLLSPLSIYPHFAQSINAQLAWKQKPLTGLRKSKSVRAFSHTREIENRAERKSRQTARWVMSLLTAVHWLLLPVWGPEPSVLAQCYPSLWQRGWHYSNSETVGILSSVRQLGTASSPNLVFTDLCLSKTSCLSSTPCSK